jgi:hypothetical protein
MKKLHTLALNSGPLQLWQVFCHWTIKADTRKSHLLVPFRNTKDSFLPVTFTGLADLFPQIGSLDQHLCIWLWWYNVKILTTVAGVLGSNP